MIFGSLLQQKFDAFFSHFRTKFGELRVIRRDMRAQIPLDEAEHRELLKYAQDVQQMRIEGVREDLARATGNHLKRGYYLLKQEEMTKIFDALTHVMQEGNKFLDDLQDLENELPRDEALTPDEREEVAHAINVGIVTLERSFNRIISDLAGFDSTTMSKFKLLERESQSREIIGQLLSERRIIHSYDRARKNSMAALKEAETPSHVHKLELFDPSASDKTLDGQIAQVVSELNVIIDDLVMLLQGVYANFVQLWNSEQGKGQRLAEISAEHALSTKVLTSPTTQGGFGLGGEDAQLLQDTAQKTEEFFRSKLNGLIKEARLFLSKAEHQKLRETA